jgi:peptide/nickel transport system permease protein
MKYQSGEPEVEIVQYPKRNIRFLSNLRRLLRMPLAVFGFVVIIIIIICAIFAPWIAPHDPLTQNAGHYLESPSTTFLLGTDQLGRDVLSRLIYGSRIALLASLGAVGFGIVVGTPIGLISAYTRGWVDSFFMRIMDALVSFPSLIIAVALVAAIGASVTNVILAIGLANVPWIARVVRSQALSLREREFVLAARATGASTLRIINSHIWPNCTAPVIVQGTLGMAYAILIEASLGFLGVGVQPPTPTWGNMLRYAFPLLARAPLLSIMPGLFIFLLVLAFNFVGDAMRDVLDPRLRNLIR